MPAVPIEAVFLVALVGVIGVIVWLVNERRSEARRERFDELQHDAQAWAARARDGIPVISTRLILKDDEHALLEEDSALLESRAYRVYGGAGTRIGRVYVGGGASESQQRIKHIDEGKLTLTTKRLIFDGSHENRTVQLSQVLSVNPWSDAIEVSTQRRAKSQVYRVENPLIWTSAIEAVAAGKLKLHQRKRE